MKTYIVTKVRHSDRDARGLEDLFQLYLIKIMSNKYDVITEYISNKVIEIAQTRHMDFNTIAWHCIKPEIETLMSEFIKAMLFTECNIEVGIDFIYWDEDSNEGELVKYRMDYDYDLSIDKMKVDNTDSLTAKVKAVQYILDSELISDSCLKDEFIDILQSLKAELESKNNQPSYTAAPTEVANEEKPAEVSNKIDEHVCRTMNEFLEKMNKLIATVEMLEEKMLNK